VGGQARHQAVAEDQDRRQEVEEDPEARQGVEARRTQHFGLVPKPIK
jgi:hypothetical protein